MASYNQIMVVGGRRKSIAFFIALGVGLIVFILLLYVGWVLLGWRHGILLFFGVVVTLLLIAGVVLNTTFLVREIRRNAQHDAFINAVTHELKTPVASIRLYLETLQSRPVDDQRRHEFYQTMLEDSDRLLATIEQILRTGRIGHTRRHLHLSTVDFGALVEECLTRERRFYHLSEDATTFHAATPTTIRCDADEVRAAVSNLIDNAIKYGGKEPKVEVEMNPVDERSVAIKVKDNGPGIPKDEAHRIFKRFYRIRGPQSTRIKGTGLGLFIVRSVAKRHGGKAWVESEGDGRGSTFILQLPKGH